jgi:dCMP deaminase
MKWDEYFINIAHQVKLKSKDERTQIGVVMVGKDNEIVSTGYNSFPRGLNDNLSERQERPEKYFWFEHAERNAIYNAARIGVSTLGTTMYMTCDISCADCARAIINSGVSKVVFSRTTKQWPEIWLESWKRSLQMFQEAGVKIEYYDE